MRRVVLATLVAVVAAGVLLGRSGPQPEPQPARSEPAAAAASANRDPTIQGAGKAARGTVEPLARPRSLRGTRVDGGLATDADGHFVATLDARRLFDYFLTASGEVSDEALRARIQHEIERRLPAMAAREATEVCERYLAYRDRVRELATVDVPGDDDLDARLATLIAIRREVLGPTTAEAFFAEEEADTRRMLDARRIANDPTLSPEERAERVEAVFADAEAELPAEVREARAAGRLATTLRSAEAEVRARGGDDAAVAAMRERLAGPEAAARLADLDRRRNAWQGRVDAFRAARERIRHDPTLSSDAQAAAIARLADESFTPAERRRVDALDRIGAHASGTEP
jgi:lipase chaperone LimK